MMADPMELIDHPERGYAHAPGISPYSAGVLALPGHSLRRVTLRQPRPWREGFALIDQVLAAAGRASADLCSIELRCPTPHSFGGFGSFNDDYRHALADRGILLDDGSNPVARTNVAPGVDPPGETQLFAFGFTVAGPEQRRPSFIVSGAGDLRDQSDLRPEAIVGGDEDWEASAVERTVAVLDEIEARLVTLGLGWSDTDAVSVYSIEAIETVLAPVVLARLGEGAAARGVHWYWSQPPIAGLRYEMDARGGVDEACY